MLQLKGSYGSGAQVIIFDLWFVLLRSVSMGQVRSGQVRSGQCVVSIFKRFVCFVFFFASCVSHFIASIFFEEYELVK